MVMAVFLVVLASDWVFVSFCVVASSCFVEDERRVRRPVRWSHANELRSPHHLRQSHCVASTASLRPDPLRSRDVKPENIMYTSRDESAGIKLTDFGLALLYPGASTILKDDNLVGTPGYAEAKRLA